MLNQAKFREILFPSFTKKARKFAAKRDSKIFLEVAKGIEHFQQNALVKLGFSDSDSGQVQGNSRVFLTEIEDHITPCFEHIFHKNLKDKRLWTSLFLQILQVATEIGIYHRFFSGDKFTSKNLKELSRQRHFLSASAMKRTSSWMLYFIINLERQKLKLRMANKNFCNADADVNANAEADISTNHKNSGT